MRAAWESPLPRLLVFDNCEDEALLAQWRPSSGACRVLVTSRRTEWKAVLGVRALPLDVLRPEESLALLRNYRPNLPADDAALQGIASELGDLPLALHLAGSFLERYRDAMTPAQYLEQLRQPDLLEHRSLRGWTLSREVSPTRHEQDVARTFVLSYERLESANPTDERARALLARAACFAPGEPIPRDLLLATLDMPADAPAASLQAEDALARLGELGLLERAPGAWRLHRLLVAFVRTVGNETGARDVVEQAMVAWAGRRNEASSLAALSGVQTHLRAVTETAQMRQSVQAPGLCNLLGSHSQITGDYEGALKHHERALELLGRPVPGTTQRRFARWKLWGGTLWQYLLQLRSLLSHLWSRRPLAGPHRTEARLVEAVRAYSRLPRLYLILHNDGRLAKYVGLCALNLAKATGSSAELARAYINPSAGLALTPPPSFLLNVLAPLADNVYGRRAREMARRNQDRPTLGDVLKLTSLYNVIMGQWEEGRKAAEEARGIFHDLQDWYEEIECVSVLAQLAYFKGELADALEMRTAAYTMAHERGASFQQAWARVWQGTILLRLGRIAEAVPALEESCTMLAAGRDRLHRLPGYGLLALAHWRLGNPQRVWEAAQQVVQRAEDLALAYTLLPGPASVAEVSLALWEACSYPTSPEREALAKSAWKACRALRYTRRLPIGRPSAWL